MPQDSNQDQRPNHNRGISLQEGKYRGHGQSQHGRQNSAGGSSPGQSPTFQPSQYAPRIPEGNEEGNNHDPRSSRNSGGFSGGVGDPTRRMIAENAASGDRFSSDQIKIFALEREVDQCRAEARKLEEKKNEIINFFWLLVGIFTLLSFLVVETIYRGRKSIVIMMEDNEDDNTSDRNKLRRDKRSSVTRHNTSKQHNDFTSARTFKVWRGIT